jgi:ribosomal-protein-alanine N-acetyltransferase
MQNELLTNNLKLRPFTINDVDDVVSLAGDKEVSKTTLQIPHPYMKVDAENWISSHKKRFFEGTLVSYAIVLKNRTLIGCISLRIDKNHHHAELAYWIGKKYWNNGYLLKLQIKLWILVLMS